MTRIVHVITSLAIGGAERMLQRLVAEHRRSDNVDSVIISLTGDGIIGRELREAGFRVEVIGLRFGLTGLGAFIRLVKLLRALRPDVVQTWLYHSDLIGGLAARIAGVRTIIWNIRSVVSGSNRLTLGLVRVNAWASRVLPSSIICCGVAARDYHVSLGYDAQRIVVLPNGYDMEHFAPRPACTDRNPNQPMVIAIGRNDALKDYPTFIRAIRIAAEQIPGLKAEIHGRGCGKDPALVELARKAGLASIMTFHDETDDVRGPLSRADVYCLSSTSEGFPNAVAEAMAMGVPCVVTDAGDAGIIVGDTGVVVPVSDEKALAAGLVRIAGLAEHDYRRLSHLARSRIGKHYEMGHVAKLYFNHYRNFV